MEAIAVAASGRSCSVWSWYASPLALIIPNRIELVNLHWSHYWVVWPHWICLYPKRHGCHFCNSPGPSPTLSHTKILCMPSSCNFPLYNCLINSLNENLSVIFSDLEYHLLKYSITYWKAHCHYNWSIIGVMVLQICTVYQLVPVTPHRCSCLGLKIHFW